MTTAVPIAWLVARSAGLIAFGLLTLSVWLGLGMSTRVLAPKWTKHLLGLHRTLAWTGLSMVGLHIGALLADPVMHFGALAVLVPGAAAYRPGAVALGHALLVGTDLRGFGGPVTAVLAAAPVLWLSFYRLLTPRALPARAATV